ncbi:hypothetical protein OHD62_12740 [Mesorhizobium sp. YC-39]|nr:MULTISPECIES: hypothetical protein [unclassified Mesorhizobium]MCV3207510.1 hypothetical protein [Mesorhizobium sp. YC-2]MCV3229237.1 hypothetical protein [Mesorhizobium sp. YC-39]
MSVRGNPLMSIDTPLTILPVARSSALFDGQGAMTQRRPLSQ